MTLAEDHSSHEAEDRQVILNNIEQYGCHLALLSPTNYLPGFAYSIGLYKKFGHPELICFGLSTNVLGAVLNHGRDLIKCGETLVPGVAYQGFLEGYPIQLIEVNKSFYPNYVGYGRWFYEYSVDFPLYQVVWPDKQHKWPWEEGFNPAWKLKQPLLDRGTDFKFYESKKLGVFTTKQALEGDPILYVYHNSDGDWQFHTSAEPSLDDVKLVCIEDLTKLDPSINEIYHLDYGWRAWRSSKDVLWEWEKEEEDSEEMDTL